MNSEERLVLDELFERAIARVVQALVREGFGIRALNRGNLPRASIHATWSRYALLEASLPQQALDICESSAHDGARLCLVELTGSRTLVTVERSVAPDRLLASPLCVAGRVAKALAPLARPIHAGGSLNVRGAFGVSARHPAARSGVSARGH